jgi:hypothetical protein
MSAKADIEQLKEQVLGNLKVIDDEINYILGGGAIGNMPEQRISDRDLREAMAGLETFIAIALRVFAKTNPSKIRSEAITQEIASRISGKTLII